MPEVNRTAYALMWKRFMMKEHGYTDDQANAFLQQCQLTAKYTEVFKIEDFLNKWDAVDKYRTAPGAEYTPITDDMAFMRNILLDDLERSMQGNFKHIRVIDGRTQQDGLPEGEHRDADANTPGDDAPREGNND